MARHWSSETQRVIFSSSCEEMFIFILYFATSQDFDPAEHDAMVAKMFDNDYYEGEGAAQDEKLPGKLKPF